MEEGADPDGETIQQMLVPEQVANDYGTVLIRFKSLENLIGNCDLIDICKCLIKSPVFIDQRTFPLAFMHLLISRSCLLVSEKKLVFCF